MVDVPFVVINSFAIFLAVIPSPWHVAAWNSATCYMMLWTTIGCIIHLVNSIVWYHNLSNPSPVYCDIATKLIVGLSMAIPLSSLCINRRLHKIATMSSVAITKATKRRDVIIDTIVAVLLPMIFMAIHYTMQGHRYDIMENFGCLPTTYATIPAYILVIAPPVVVSIISLGYAMLSLRAFIRRRTEFNHVLKSSSTGLDAGRYFRLMALASSELVIGLPTSLYFFVTNIKEGGLQPWISWEDTHYNFSHINYYPVYFFKFNRSMQVAYELNRWTFPFIAILFFAFFGVGQEARNNYRRAYYTLLRPFGVKPPVQTKSSGYGKSFGSSKGLGDSAADATAVVLSLPPKYTSPTHPTSSRWSCSASTLGPWPESPSLATPRFDYDHDEVPPSATSPAPPLPSSPALPVADSTVFSSPSHQPVPRLDVHITTTTHTSRDDLV